MNPTYINDFLNINKLSASIISEIKSLPDFETSIIKILSKIKQARDIEAIGIRLSDGPDYPYFYTKGFSSEFVRKEMYLCEKDEFGNTLCDHSGQPLLECMCGNVIRGRTNPALPFFTVRGSFWTNSTSMLLASTTDEDRQNRTRNQCNSSKFESVALIPISYFEKCFGLLQLNDSRKDMFTLNDIFLYEALAESIAISFSIISTSPQFK